MIPPIVSQNIRSVAGMAACMAMLLAAASCTKKQADNEVVEVLRKNLQFTQEENLEGVQSTMHPGAPGQEEMKAVMAQIFEAYDLNYNMDSAEVVFLDPSQAIVRVVQTTTKESGPAFRNNRTTVKQELRRDSGQWKIFSSTLEGTEFLD